MIDNRGGGGLEMVATDANCFSLYCSPNALLWGFQEKLTKPSDRLSLLNLCSYCGVNFLLLMYKLEKEHKECMAICITYCMPYH